MGQDRKKFGIWVDGKWVRPEGIITEEVPPKKMEGLVEESDPYECTTDELEHHVLEALKDGEEC